MKKRLLSILLAVCMVMSLIAPTAAFAAEEYSGYCGGESNISNLTWSLNTSTGVLTISGAGIMGDYSRTGTSAPWSSKSSYITSVIIEEGVTSIGPYAFKDCTNIASIVIPASVNVIGKCAFSCCKKLKSVILPDGLTTIAEFTFADCISLESVTIPDSVTSIGEDAFGGCEALTNVVLPDSVTTIDKGAFSGCWSLTKFEIPANVNTIGANAFLGTLITEFIVAEGNNQYCSVDGVLFNKSKTTLLRYPGGSVLDTYEIPDSVTKLEAYAFCVGKYLKHITIPNSVTEIGDYCFARCYSLENISIPSSVKTMGSAVFDNCWVLNNVVYPASKFEGGSGLFSDCVGLTNATIEDGVVSISSGAFYGCFNLTSITIPDSVTDIGDQAFWDCSTLTDITIPANVTSIGCSAFGSCDKLKSIYFEGNAPEVTPESSSMRSFASDVTLYYIDGKIRWSTPEWNGWAAYPIDGKYEPPEVAEITKITPANGSEKVALTGLDLYVTFDREVSSKTSSGVADLDFTKEPLSVYRAADDELIYQVTESATTPGTSLGATVTKANPDTVCFPKCSFDAETEYYVTMGEGFIILDDGTVSPEIKKGDWQFTTTEPVAEAFSTEASVKVGTGVSGRESIQDNVKWEDNWFATDSTKYNHELARTSMVLSAAAYTSAENMKNVWADFNFDTIKTYYPPKATKDNNDFVAYSFAAKELTGDADGITLIAIAVRGTPGSAEWYSNFNIGKYAFLHTGFAQAASSLKENLESYLTLLKNAGYKIDNTTKYLITGHSRGAAVANIVAMNLTGNNYSDKTNIFAYTFATPAVTTRASQSEYNNIFNIINLEDFVPHVPLAAWGFGRYGIDIPLPSKSYYSSEYFDKIHTKMETQFIDMTGKSELHTYKEGTQEVNGLTTHVVALSPTRTAYYDTANVFCYGISALEMSWKTMHEYFTVLASFLATDDLAEQAASVTSLVSSLNGDYAPITAFFIQHETFNQRVFDAHCPALYLSWMRSCTAEELFGYYNDESYPLYKQITIKCPVDVFVYNESGTLVASVVDETVVKDTLAVSVNEGEKVVDLPSDQTYQVEIKARDTGTVDYIVEEKTANGSFDTTRTVFFDDIAIATGDILTGSIDTMENTAAENYSLTKNDETVIIATSDSNGNLFSVIVSNAENGTVSATPAWVAQGNEVTITVTPDPGYELDTLTVTDKNGNEIQLTDQGSGRYTFTMPDSQVQVHASFVKGEAPTGLPFTDVKSGDWFYEDVAYVYANNLMNGTSAYTFSPQGTTTRGMIVTILYRLENEPAANLSAFADVASDAYFAKAVGWASANGIVTGYSDVKFGPNDSITREQMAAILYRYAQYKGYDVSQKADLSKYQDQAAVSAYAKNAMSWANAQGLINGVTDTSLSPQGNAIRAQAAAILHRFCETVAK